jgi:DNA polymerase IV
MTRPVSQDNKPIVKPEWLEKSIKEGKRQPYNQYQALYVRQGKFTDVAESSGDHSHDSADGEELATSAQADLSATAKFVCQRELPLVCPNQELVEQIDVIRRARELDMNWQSALSYARAIAVGSLQQCCVRCANLSSR